jgi:SAM-dependent methyltransferase
MTTVQTDPAQRDTAQTDPAGGADAPSLQEQAGALLGQVAGYMSHRAVEIGLRCGLLEAVASKPGTSADELAELLGLDDFYVAVWCRAGVAAGVLDRSGDGFTLAAHMQTLLLDAGSPAYVGGLYPLVLQPEMFDRFADNLATGERLWWDATSPDWIAGVARTGRPFYTRLVPGGLAQVPGLVERLTDGARIVDSACGTGAGLARLASAYPGTRLVGVDGDAHSVDVARANLSAAGIGDRVELVVSPLEEMAIDEPATLVINNISMHECRDIDQVAERVGSALEPGGWFVISDFPFPDTDEGLRSVPGRIMSGIQFFEAQIDDQLLPRAAYDDLLARHGFVETGWFQLTPVHAVTYGRTPY